MYADFDNDQVLLYGPIWQGDGPWIVSQLTSFFNEHAGDAIVRLHTPGGSVIDANLIYNCLAKIPNLHIIVDGLAASMGSILMLAARKISICENAWIMVHAPSGSVSGNASDFTAAAKLLTGIEKNFLKKYAAKTGRAEADLQDWMKGDNWFSAEEALAEKLVDEIIEPVLEEMDTEAFGKKYNLVAIMKGFEAYNRPADPDSPAPKPPVTPQINNMKLNATNLSALKLEANSTDVQANEAVEAILKERDDLAGKLKARTDAEEAEKETKAEALATKGVTEGRYTAAEKEHYKALALANYTLAETTISKLPARKPLTGQITDRTPAGSEEQTFDWWRKNDPAGLLEIKNADPDRYKAIQEAKPKP